MGVFLNRGIGSESICSATILSVLTCMLILLWRSPQHVVQLCDGFRFRFLETGTDADTSHVNPTRRSRPTNLQIWFCVTILTPERRKIQDPKVSDKTNKMASMLQPSKSDHVIQLKRIHSRSIFYGTFSNMLQIQKEG